MLDSASFPSRSCNSLHPAQLPPLPAVLPAVAHTATALGRRDFVRTIGGILGWKIVCPFSRCVRLVEPLTCEQCAYETV